MVRIGFDSLQKKAMALSAILFLASVVFLLIKGLTLGLDFTGGRLTEYQFSSPVEIAEIEAILESNSVQGNVQLAGSAETVLVRLDRNIEQNKADIIQQEILENFEGSQVVRVDFVGPKVGEELSEQGGMATLVTLICILIYVSLRFEWRFAVGAVIALVHDVFITLGFFSVFSLEFDLSVLAAILAVIGYSLNDTIVIFDRIRENFISVRKVAPRDIIDNSINETLSRTIMTSLTTLLVLFALFIVGGASIHNFSLALILGILIGTYSSIFIASPILLLLGTESKHLIPKKIEGDGAEV